MLDTNICIYLIKQAPPALIERFEACPLGDIGISVTAAVVYGRIRAVLKKERPIGALDLLIAAQALSLGVRLVTNNKREFRRVPGLRVENRA